MDRERQIELIKSAEARTKGYLRSWLKDPQFKAALHRDTKSNNDGKPTPFRPEKRTASR